MGEEMILHIQRTCESLLVGKAHVLEPNFRQEEKILNKSNLLL